MNDSTYNDTYNDVLREMIKHNDFSNLSEIVSPIERMVCRRPRRRRTLGHVTRAWTCDAAQESSWPGIAYFP